MFHTDWPWSTLCGSAGSPWRCGWGWWCCLWHWRWCDVGTGLKRWKKKKAQNKKLGTGRGGVKEIRMRCVSVDADRRWCIRCCPRRRRPCPSAPAAAPCGWRAPVGLCGWLAALLWTPAHTRSFSCVALDLSIYSFTLQHCYVCVSTASRTCMKTLPMMTSSSSLNTVLNTTVTLSFLASKYLRRQNMSNVSEISWKHDPQFVSYIKYAETCKTCFTSTTGTITLPPQPTWTRRLCSGPRLSSRPPCPPPGTWSTFQTPRRSSSSWASRPGGQPHLCWLVVRPGRRGGTRCSLGGKMPHFISHFSIKREHVSCHKLKISKDTCCRNEEQTNKCAGALQSGNHHWFLKIGNFMRTYPTLVRPGNSHRPSWAAEIKNKITQQNGQKMLHEHVRRFNPSTWHALFWKPRTDQSHPLILGGLMSFSQPVGIWADGLREEKKGRQTSRRRDKEKKREMDE